MRKGEKEVYFLILIIMFCSFSIQANELIEVIKDKDSTVRDVRKVMRYGGVSVNSKDSSGNTALHWAYYVQRGDFIDVLLVAGANLEIKNAAGNTPVQIGLNVDYVHIPRPIKPENIPVGDNSVRRPFSSRCAKSFSSI